MIRHVARYSRLDVIIRHSNANVDAEMESIHSVSATIYLELKRLYGVLLGKRVRAGQWEGWPSRFVEELRVFVGGTKKFIKFRRLIDQP